MKIFQSSTKVIGAIIIVLVFVFSGCATEPMKNAAAGKGIDTEQRAGLPSQETQSSMSAQTEAPAKTAGGATKGELPTICLCEQYTVREGDSLWWIAKYKDIYNDPFLWPVLYEANKDIVKNPRLLYPGQELDIPRGGYTPQEIKNIRKKAGAPKPYLPQQKANLPLD